MPLGIFAVIIGPTAVGKNTVLEAVLERLPSAIHVLSTTCRAPRPGEREGIDYHFLPCQDFQDRAAKGDFFEHAEYSQHWYGTSRSGLERARALSPLALKIVEIQGAAIIKAKMPEAVTIFIQPGEFDDLSRRWHARAAENGAIIDPNDLERRLATARQEIALARTCDHVVTNRDGRLEECIRETLDILKARARLP